MEQAALVLDASNGHAIKQDRAPQQIHACIAIGMDQGGICGQRNSRRTNRASESTVHIWSQACRSCLPGVNFRILSTRIISNTVFGVCRTIT